MKPLGFGFLGGDDRVFRGLRNAELHYLFGGYLDRFAGGWIPAGTGLTFHADKPSYSRNNEHM